MGFNLAGLEILSREVREQEVHGAYLDETAVDDKESVMEKGRKKRGFASVA